MGRIFIAAAQKSVRGDGEELSTAIGSLLEAQELNPVLDLVVQILRSRNYEIVSVPQDLHLTQTIDWINNRARRGDVALELCADISDHGSRGAIIFYIANNDQRKTQSEQLLQAYLRRIPQLSSRGAKPDSQTELGRLAFCRQITIPALQMTIGSLIDLDDRRLIQSQRQEAALGIAEGLATWSRAVPQEQVDKLIQSSIYPTINLVVNGAAYEDKGILVEGNAYIPVDLIDQLGIDLSLQSTIRRIRHQNIVFVRAIDLREFNLITRFEANSFAANNPSPILSLRSALSIPRQQLEQIMGQGHSSEVQLMVFLKSYNSDGLIQFPDLPKLYREEAGTEGVNYDIAFAQMCVETNFLRFSKSIRPEQNNFAGLGTIDRGKNENTHGASFSSPRIGIRAQIQHLKGYASTEPLVQAIVDPRFNYIRRGIAPSLQQLSGRWAADSQYHLKVSVVLRRLYESAGFL